MHNLEEMMGENIDLTLTFRDADSSYQVNRIHPSPCMTACPAGVNVKSYVSLISSGRFAQALAVVKEKNPFPGICGRVCPHPCEEHCTRGEVDAPLAIASLKRFVADYELRNPTENPGPLPRSRDEKIAVVGSGPAGLTVANDLIRKGFGVTVFEQLPQAGGMMLAGIPSYRLPRDIIRVEVEAIERLGVKIKTNTRIAGPAAIDKLFEKGFSAVFLGIGAHRGRKLAIAGESKYEGFHDAISFLHSVNLGKPLQPGKRVIVVGGGSSAFDSARTAIRLGSQEITILYRRTRQEMPATAEEIAVAEPEGIKLHYLAAPVKILGKKGKVSGMTCIGMELAEPDESGRRRPVPIAGSEFTLKADTIISAISQEPDLSFLPDDHGFKISKWQTFKADAGTLLTTRPGVFVGGDAYSGPATIIDAIATGHVAAQSIERYLNKEPLEQDCDRALPAETEIKADLSQYEKSRRTAQTQLAMSKITGNFEEVELGYDEAAAIAEASRCLRCGPCEECFLCVPECGKRLHVLIAANGAGAQFLRYPIGFDAPQTGHGTVAAALRSSSNTIDSVQISPLTCYVNADLCRGCGECTTVCEYSAPALSPKDSGLFVSRIDENICKGCGTCVTVCPSSAIEQRYFTQERFLDKLMKMDPTRKNVVTFTCSWYGSHLNRSSFTHLTHQDYNLLFQSVACSGRIEPALILNAFEHGAEGVLVVGCGMGACHYGFGNKHAEEHFGTVRNLLNVLGFSAEKFQWAWTGAEQSGDVVEAVDVSLNSIQGNKTCEEST